MIVVELSFVCDADGCGDVVYVEPEAFCAASDRTQIVAVPSDIPDGWSCDNVGNIYCPRHVDRFADCAAMAFHDFG